MRQCKGHREKERENMTGGKSMKGERAHDEVYCSKSLMTQQPSDCHVAGCGALSGPRRGAKASNQAGREVDSASNVH